MNIVAPTLEEIEYVIDMPEVSYSPPAFTVTTVPIEHNLCGALVYKAYYDSTEIAADEEFLSYSGSGGSLTAEFLDKATYGYLIDTTVPYSLTAEFANWPSATNPTVSTSTATSDVLYLDPCDHLTTFTPATQDNIPDDTYSGTEFSWNLIEFTVVPTFCIPTVTYTISNVSGPSLLRTEPNGTHDYTSFFTNYDLTLDSDSTGPADGELLVSASQSHYDNQELAPGTYTFTLMCTDQKGNSVTTTFTWTLLDPCLNPTIVQYEWDPYYLSYTISDTVYVPYVSYTWEPSFCRQTMTYT